MIANNRFIKLNDAIQPILLNLIPTILPHGRRQGPYWIALNPTRNDTKLGSFKINLQTGMWADYASNDSGSDAISLVAYLHGYKQGEAATYLEKITGVAANDN